MTNKYNQSILSNIQHTYTCKPIGNVCTFLVIVYLLNTEHIISIFFKYYYLYIKYITFTVLF